MLVNPLKDASGLLEWIVFSAYNLPGKVLELRAEDNMRWPFTQERGELGI